MVFGALWVIAALCNICQVVTYLQWVVDAHSEKLAGLDNTSLKELLDREAQKVPHLYARGESIG